MPEITLFQAPAALIIYAAAFFCSLSEHYFKSKNGIPTLISAVLALCASAVLIIRGGSLWEAAAILIVFFLFNAGVRK